jgi:hypothetical protein
MSHSGQGLQRLDAASGVLPKLHPMQARIPNLDCFQILALPRITASSHPRRDAEPIPVLDTAGPEPLGAGCPQRPAKLIAAGTPSSIGPED